MTNEQKQEILTKYLQWINQVSDDLEDKVSFAPVDLVMKVISLCDEVYDEQVEGLYERISYLEYDKKVC